MAEAAGSLGAEARVTDAAPEAGAEKPTVPKEQTALPKSSNGVIGHVVQPRSPTVVPPAAAEEDEVEEIEREESQPQAVRILYKRGHEVVVVEEEDTTRELRRLEFTLFWSDEADQGDNSDCRAARAQHEQDLAESNVRDLEYQKGILSKQLATMFEQLQGKSEQLATISEQLTSASNQLEQKFEQLRKQQDTELGQLHQNVEQLREEKAKESGRADKLAEELKFDVLDQEVRTQRNKFDAIVAEVKSVLDCIDLEAAPQPDDRPLCLDTIIERCNVSWENFKSFNRDAIFAGIAVKKSL
ncbi:uncharacterized protein [Miscanthus floridulus]|uniref:uncharacterized protein n=1 Tax=Miscanthus floridulus TaxID=154761 RepID=UPI003457883A